MIIRDACQADADGIAAFWAPQILETSVTFRATPKAPQDVVRMIETQPCFLVAEWDNAVMGFVAYDQFRAGEGYQHTMEHTIILAPSAQRQGAGLALMQAAMAHARARRVHSLLAGVSGENTSAIAFHTRLGFESVGVVRDAGRKFDRWIDLVLMQKRL